MCTWEQSKNTQKWKIFLLKLMFVGRDERVQIIVDQALWAFKRSYFVQMASGCLSPLLLLLSSLPSSPVTSGGSLTEEELEFYFHIDPGFSGLPRRHPPANSLISPGRARHLTAGCVRCVMHNQSFIHIYSSFRGLF